MFTVGKVVLSILIPIVAYCFGADEEDTNTQSNVVNVTFNAQCGKLHAFYFGIVID